MKARASLVSEVLRTGWSSVRGWLIPPSDKWMYILKVLSSTLIILKIAVIEVTDVGVSID